MNAPVTAPAAAGGGHSLDELIFVQLVGRALQVNAGKASVAPDAASLAKLSLELADVYREAHKAKLAALGPKNVGYEVQMDDIMNWEKK
jgi:hypothetical protein